MFTVEKDGIKKVLKTEYEAAMYISAGWKKVANIKKKEEKPSNTNKFDYSKNND